MKVFPVTPLPLKVPPAGEPASVTEDPFTHTAAYVPADTTGNAFTVTRTWSVLLHAPDVTVTVYVVVPATEDETVGLETVLLLSPVVGDQL